MKCGTALNCAEEGCNAPAAPSDKWGSTDSRDWLGANVVGGCPHRAGSSNSEPAPRCDAPYPATGNPDIEPGFDALGWLWEGTTDCGIGEYLSAPNGYAVLAPAPLGSNCETPLERFDAPADDCVRLKGRIEPAPPLDVDGTAPRVGCRADWREGNPPVDASGGRDPGAPDLAAPLVLARPLALWLPPALDEAPDPAPLILDLLPLSDKSISSMKVLLGRI
jgi:hypothetical protein